MSRPWIHTFCIGRRDYMQWILVRSHGFGFLIPTSLSQVHLQLVPWPHDLPGQGSQRLVKASTPQEGPKLTLLPYWGSLYKYVVRQQEHMNSACMRLCTWYMSITMLYYIPVVIHTLLQKVQTCSAFTLIKKVSPYLKHNFMVNKSRS